MFKHLQQTNQKYFDHAKFAFTAGLRLLIAGAASIIHSIFPDVLPFVAEEITKQLAAESHARQRQRKTRADNQIS